MKSWCNCFSGCRVAQALRKAIRTFKGRLRFFLSISQHQRKQLRQERASTLLAYFSKEKTTIQRRETTKRKPKEKTICAGGRGRERKGREGSARLKQRRRKESALSRPTPIRFFRRRRASPQPARGAAPGPTPAAQASRPAQNFDRGGDNGKRRADNSLRLGRGQPWAGIKFGLGRRLRPEPGLARA